MSSETIPLIGERQLSDADWFNIFNRVLSGDLLPRNSSGVVTDLAGQLGTDSLKWLICRIASGHWVTGDIKVIHPYNGDAAPGQGWMLCDGRTIGQSAYDTEHGVGSWATYVISSIVNGLKLPNMTSRLTVGKATTPQDGSAPITAVGNASSQKDFSHNHQWLRSNGTTSNDQSYDSSGTLANITSAGTKTFDTLLIEVLQAQVVDFYTSIALSSTQSVKPDSIEACFYMRVV